ncbi:MAG: 5-oxoprolinase subunit PxpA [Bacteroidetes bacterium]|nr:5-oxoprolinase subunit PxpA [Bacteroidota bacterium]
MDIKKIHINCDLGEGFGNETAIMPYIQACNIACGGHAGDSETIKKTVELAAKFEVEIGAHPAYPDKKHFGRMSMNIPHAQLIDSVKNQIKRLKDILDAKGIRLQHIKPHGALYNDLSQNRLLASAFLKAISHYKNDVFLYAAYGSAFSKMAMDAGFQVKKEAFTDRNYLDDYRLVSREMPDAVIHDARQIGSHLKNMMVHHKIRTLSGKEIPVFADTYCFHSDHPMAAQTIQDVVKSLSDASN